MIYLIILVAVILIICLIPFKISFYYEYIDTQKYMIRVSYLFGLIKFTFDSTSQVIKDDERYKGKNEKNKAGLIHAINYSKYFVDKGKIEKLYFRVNLGLEDPSLLAITIGIAWAAINSCFGYLLRNKNIDKIKERDIQVIPLFDQNVFELYFLCIISINLVYIITAYIRYLKEKRGGDSIARASNRRINEINNE